MTVNDDTQKTLDISVQIARDVDPPSTQDSWQKIRAEGGFRLKRIGKIFQSAFSAAQFEIKAGSETIAPFAKDLSSDAIGSVKNTSASTFNHVHQTWKESPDKSSAVRSLITSFTQTLKSKVIPWYQSELQAIKNALKNTVDHQNVID